MGRRIVLLLVVAACGAPAPAPKPLPLPRPATTASAPPPPATPTCDGDDFGLPASAEADVAARIAKKRGTMGVATTRMVATSHALATEAGLSVLRAGGSAADAFVAAALAQDVVLPGVTSTAGLVGVLVYEAKSKTFTYVHGGVADPLDPARRWQPGDRAPGKMALVPGAPAAYAELSRRFGKKPLSMVVEPAAKLATDGFLADALYARSIVANRKKLEASDYGKTSFFHDGKPVAEGETLKLAAFGATLRSFGKDPAWFYRAPWARDAVKLANARGGAFEMRDFEAYRPEIAAPLHGRYLGHDLYTAGHGGVKVLASLGAWEALRGSASASPARSPAALEMLLRVQRAVNALPMLHQRDLVARGPAVEPELAAQIAAITARVASETAEPMRAGNPGTHSSAVIVVDANGDIVVGTHTIESMNWGEGLFVGGVPLSAAGPIGFDDPKTATQPMRIDPLTATIVVKDGAPVAALTVYGTGLHPADVQILDGVIARHLDAEDAVLEPRVGYFAFDHAAGTIDYAKNSVDPRFSRELLCALDARGLRLERSMPGFPVGLVDTGFPTLVTIAPGRLHGMTPDMPYIHGVAAGD